MKIVFIDPDMKKNGGNMGLGYLAAVLLDKGHQVSVIGSPCTSNEINLKIRKLKPDIVGFSLRSDYIQKVQKIAGAVKKENNVLLICGGPEITIDGKNFLTDNSWCDIAVIGEAEQTMLDIVEYVQGKIEIDDINGIIARTDNGLLVTGKRYFNNDLDSIPFPDFSTFDIFKNGIKEIGIITSRGCPYNCSFCNGPKVMGRKWRYRSADNIIKELKSIKELYGETLEWLDIFDDNFTFNLKRAKEVCQKMIDAKLNFNWRLPNGIRADKVDDELCSLMKQAGCKSVHIGVESGSSEVFKQISKGETLEDIENGVRLLKQHGIQTDASFIIGLPGSNFNRDMESIRFARKIHLDVSYFHIFCPFKCTKARDMTFNQKGVRILRSGSNATSEYWSSNPFSIFDTEDYPERDRIKVFMKGNLRLNNYLFTRDFSKSSVTFHRIYTLLKLILVYDPLYLPAHLFCLSKKAVGFIQKNLPGTKN